MGQNHKIPQIRGFGIVESWLVGSEVSVMNHFFMSWRQFWGLFWSFFVWSHEKVARGSFQRRAQELKHNLGQEAIFSLPDQDRVSINLSSHVTLASYGVSFLICGSKTPMLPPEVPVRTSVHSQWLRWQVCGEGWIFSPYSLYLQSTSIFPEAFASWCFASQISVSHVTLILGLSVFTFERKRAQEAKADITGSCHGTQWPVVWPQFNHLEMGTLVRFRLNKVWQSLAHCLAHSDWTVHTCWRDLKFKAIQF